MPVQETTQLLMNAKDKIITFNNVDKKFNDIHEFVLSKTDDGKTINFNGSDYTQITKIIASSTTKGVTLIANSNGNSIIGGKGADSITLGAGKDTVVYISGYGNDTIKNYSADDDVIELGKNTGIDAAAVSEIKDSAGNVIRADYVFTIDKQKLTIENGADKIITFVDSNGNEINYNAHYKSSSAAFEERLEADLFTDDFFMADDVDTILEPDNLIIADYKFSTNVDFLNVSNTMIQLPTISQQSKPTK